MLHLLLKLHFEGGLERTLLLVNLMVKAVQLRLNTLVLSGHVLLGGGHRACLTCAITACSMRVSMEAIWPVDSSLDGRVACHRSW